MSRGFSKDTNERDKKEEVRGPANRMCCAFGCPELGSISNSNVGPAEDAQWFCRFHFGETADRWPEITRSRRIYWQNYVEPEKKKVDVTPEYIAQVREELARFARSFGKIADPKAWAKKLKAREEAGEHLGDVQRKAWREALRHEA